MKTQSVPRVLARFGAVAAVMALMACDSGSVAQPEADDETSLAEAVAVVAADAALEDLDAMADMMPSGAWTVGGQGPGGMMGGRSDLIRERVVTYYDADGEQPAYDPLTTVSVHSVMTMEGEVERTGFSATLSRSRDMWVTGLLGEETTRTFNGTGTESHSRTHVRGNVGTRTFEMDAQATIQDVVRAVDRVAQPWPLSGTITREWQIVIGNDGTDDVVRSRTVVITFNGTQYATLTVDGETYEVDLAAGPADRPLRHGG